jgi:diacylglycerol kinase (ATP)
VVAAIALTLAAVIAQSRYEAKFHTISELVLGAAVGIGIGLLLYATLPK